MQKQKLLSQTSCPPLLVNKLIFITRSKRLVSLTTCCGSAVMTGSAPFGGFASEVSFCFECIVESDDGEVAFLMLLRLSLQEVVKKLPTTTPIALG